MSDRSLGAQQAALWSAAASAAATSGARHISTEGTSVAWAHVRVEERLKYKRTPGPVVGDAHDGRLNRRCRCRRACASSTRSFAQ